MRYIRVQRFKHYIIGYIQQTACITGGCTSTILPALLYRLSTHLIAYIPAHPFEPYASHALCIEIRSLCNFHIMKRATKLPLKLICRLLKPQIYLRPPSPVHFSHSVQIKTIYLHPNQSPIRHRITLLNVLNDN